jgi:hypothetical protein
MPSVHIIPGFAEGPWHSKQFRAELTKAGYQLTEDEHQADIIVSHSAGCYFLPAPDKEQTIILIGPPYWPGKSLTGRMARKVWYDYKARKTEHKLGYFLTKTFWNVFYFCGDIRLGLLIASNTRKNNFYRALKKQNVMIIRNDDDAWCQPDIVGRLKSDHLVCLPGEHDDCWIRPEPYVAILKSIHPPETA